MFCLMSAKCVSCQIVLPLYQSKIRCRDYEVKVLLLDANAATVISKNQHIRSKVTILNF